MGNGESARDCCGSVRAFAFSGDFSKWDVSSVDRMFLVASSFNVDLSKWDVSSVASMGHKFKLSACLAGKCHRFGVPTLGPGTDFVKA